MVVPGILHTLHFYGFRITIVALITAQDEISKLALHISLTSLFLINWLLHWIPLCLLHQRVTDALVNLTVHFIPIPVFGLLLAWEISEFTIEEWVSYILIFFIIFMMAIAVIIGLVKLCW